MYYLDRNVVFEVLEDNGTTFELGNWLDKYDRRMDTNKGLFSNNYKVPAPVPVPETAMEWVVRSESSAEVTASESSSKSSASICKSKAAANAASQRHPDSAWNAKVRELNAKVAEVLGQSYLNLLTSPMRPLTIHSGRWHCSQKTSGNTTVYHYMGRSPYFASREGLENFGNPSFHSPL